ncbi:MULTISPECIES: bifunctional 5,10-methylenetetrahydrofolate dehydrogenase/5,10-methenyltetrahydrofolate cyclohydrolase [Halolamina]|uniref:Bifunctional protein FolD n=1 Tax=Halolamina pelagica TaxID=699431 RepID=A0A1I5VD31_9EURY|nr:MULTISPECIES: tetrahydrofolate dehydrogenase/cyclohydrolase catalytic domain-containing protein [Halolamina]NHX37686.1 bifunctional 5,10-methylene-tetrahydrofolate dehydrogenase/5,10-methylene-tetrahydrofolate cyclohydrolase [Halolamina sp. R1-12]SFQ05474.1 methylenetetrahydrofolate dehydrogenase (NADP+) / methenyltetrahydrofolate cyclohydrolase [Halolamina pelagica]
MSEAIKRRADRADVIDGEAVAAQVRETVAGAVERLEAEGVTPGLATVLMSDDPASETYVRMKQRDCADVGIESRHVELDTDAPQSELFETIDDLNDDPAIDGILIQRPLTESVDEPTALRRVDPEKDVDGFHPENVGRLVTGDPRFVPCTPLGIQRLLVEAGVEIPGSDVVVVGRSELVGKPLANLLLNRGDGADATVTVCHSKTDDLAAHTSRADVVVVAAGVPELVTGEMLSAGSTVIDVGINAVGEGDDRELIGDVEYESASQVADAITPVPGGVGPMTRAMLLENTVQAAARRAGVELETE